MSDELGEILLALGGLSASGDEAEGSEALIRIRAMSDQEVTRAYVLLSNTLVARPSALSRMLEAEVRARSLPIGNRN